jgi:hypothetical protein
VAADVQSCWRRGRRKPEATGQSCRWESRRRLSSATGDKEDSAAVTRAATTTGNDRRNNGTNNSLPEKVKARNQRTTGVSYAEPFPPQQIVQIAARNGECGCLGKNCENYGSVSRIR